MCVESLIPIESEGLDGANEMSHEPCTDTLLLIPAAVPGIQNLSPYLEDTYRS
jgi:hypothetical protein